MSQRYAKNKEDRKKGLPYYLQMPLEERIEHLRERMRRKELDLEYKDAQIHEMEDEAETLRDENARLHHENDELKEKLSYLQNLLRPRNIQRKPSDSDKNNQWTQKKIGAKPGHKAYIRTVPTKIDVHAELVPDSCPNCKGRLPSPSIWHSHTQIDLPETTQTITTQYHVGWSFCSNCKENVSISNKLSRSKYGPRLHAQVGYLKFGLGLTLPKAQQWLHDQYGLDISTGELSEMLSEDAAKLSPAYEGLKSALKKEPLVSADETGWRKSGNNAWLWSFSSDRYSFYTIERGRSKDVVKNTLGEEFDGILSSDFLGSYTQIKCKKQKCWVHLLREMKKFKEKYPNNSEILHFANKVRSFYDRAIELAEKHKRKKIQPEYQHLMDDTDKFIRRNWKHPDLKTMKNRLRWHREELYTFVHAKIPPHNNAAEREIRPAVLMRKTSYNNRSDRGAKTQAIWMSLIRTCHKQNKPFLQTTVDYLTSA